LMKRIFQNDLCFITLQSMTYLFSDDIIFVISKYFYDSSQKKLEEKLRTFLYDFYFLIFA